ncbi:uncharacterized protein DNG_09069 [Cephalotrichum gorgonifer]|uniref:Zn(2)-C6 fungal-type domain-containing protein n=1 Tax=Cephalotrichum gorgonifer TaxID=2041049 RepID=A0AAE8N4Z9_9PEZI|nr:uncharacterized protein DNG_09069 [Cephalotrichum gorgonifer]
MDASDGIETSRVQKPTKATQACVRCRQKKSKCDGKSPSCSNCDARGEECVYRGFQRRRGPGKSKQHMRALEQRLLDLESRLQDPTSDRAGEHNAVPGSRTDERRAGDSPQFGAPRADGVSAPAGTDPIAFAAHAREHDIVETAARKLPLFKMIADGLPKPFPAPGRPQSMTSIPGIHIHPRPSETFLVEKMVHELCSELPMFDIPSFLHWIRQTRTLKERGNPSGWTCLNASAAVGLLMRTLNTSYRDVSPHGWTFFKNAYATFPELLIRSNDLCGVQAVLLMAMFMMRASGDTRTAVTFLASGIRVMQTNCLRMARDDSELEIRNRVFWVAYVLDMEASLGYGIPPILHDEDTDLPLPLSEIPQNTGETEPRPGSWNAAVFAYRAELATIQSRIRKRLYSAKAYSLSDDDLSETVVELGSALANWRSEVPQEIQPGRHGQTSTVVLETPVILLHLVYYNCTAMVHWAFRRHTKWKAAWQSSDTDVSEARRNQMMMSATKYKMAAGVTIRVLPRIKGKALSDIWRMMPYILATGLTLLAITLEEENPTTRLHLAMINSLVEFAQSLVDEEGLDLHGILNGCKAIRQVATDALGETTSPDRTEQLLAYTLPQAQMVVSQLQQVTHPMYVAQALLGNIPNRDTATARMLSDSLGMPWDEESPFSPWVPEGFRPETHGFKFEPEDVA